VALERELLWALIEPHLPSDPSTPVLDLGGGTGVWAIRLAEAGYQVILADISPGLLDCAREKVERAGLCHLVCIEEADICDLTRFSAASCPLILALGDPLSYCSNAAKALAEIRRVAAPEGVLIGDVENRYRGALSKRRATTWADAERILRDGVARWPDPANRAPIRQFAPAELRLAR
jgi:ubiquinone/menaquinone biosynthesis C-methylase UbiE